MAGKVSGHTKMCLTALVVFAAGFGAGVVAMSCKGSRAPYEARSLGASESRLTNDEVSFVRLLYGLQRNDKRVSKGGFSAYKVLLLTDAVKNLHALIENESDMDPAQVELELTLGIGALVKVGYREEAVTLYRLASAKGYDNYALQYYAGVALSEVDNMRARELLQASRNIIGEQRWPVTVWDVNLALCRCFYQAGLYRDMLSAYEEYATAERPDSCGWPKRNPLAMDWKELSVSEKIRRIMEDLQITRDELNNPLHTVFYWLLRADEDSTGGDSSGSEQSE